MKTKSCGGCLHCKVHTRPELPPDSRQCVIQVEETGEWQVARLESYDGAKHWVAGKDGCYDCEEMVYADEVIAWVALRELFGIGQ
jgi:hypothetical protein